VPPGRAIQAVNRESEYALRSKQRMSEAQEPSRRPWTDTGQRKPPGAGDLRAWDGLLVFDRIRIAIEAETRLRDAQSLERRYALKMRDGHVELMILLVSDTAHNRTFLDLHREALRTRFPLDGRQLLPELRAGRAPRDSGILVL
jgi:hypothetical protein